MLVLSPVIETARSLSFSLSLFLSLVKEVVVVLKESTAGRWDVVDVVHHRRPVV
jgi:hypothetical protein